LPGIGRQMQRKESSPYADRPARLVLLAPGSPREVVSIPHRYIQAKIENQAIIVQKPWPHFPPAPTTLRITCGNYVWQYTPLCRVKKSRTSCSGSLSFSMSREQETETTHLFFHARIGNGLSSQTTSFQAEWALSVLTSILRSEISTCWFKFLAHPPAPIYHLLHCASAPPETCRRLFMLVSAVRPPQSGKKDISGFFGDPDFSSPPKTGLWLLCWLIVIRYLTILWPEIVQGHRNRKRRTSSDEVTYRSCTCDGLDPTHHRFTIPRQLPRNIDSVLLAMWFC
jgi:hypothetical protein